MVIHSIEQTLRAGLEGKVLELGRTKMLFCMLFPFDSSYLR